VLADVSSKLLQQFVKCLEADVLSAGAPAAESAPAEPGAEGSGAAEPAGPVEAAAAAATAESAAATSAAAGSAAPTASAPSTPRPATPAAGPEPAPINLVGTVAGPIAKRVGPLVLVLLLGVLIGRRLRRS
jgi:hypothetical protein